MLIEDIKIGMRIKVKSAEKICKEQNCSKVSDALNFHRGGGMDTYCEKFFIVDKIECGYVFFKEGGACWSWHPEALELPYKKINIEGILCK